MELPSGLDGKVANPFYLIVSLGTLLALTPIWTDAEVPTSQRSEELRLVHVADDRPLRPSSGL